MARRSLRRRSPKFEALEERMLLFRTVIGPRAALQYSQHDHALAPEKPTAAVTDRAEANHPIALHAEEPVRNDLAVARASKHHHSKLTRKPHRHKLRGDQIGRGSAGGSGG